MITSRIKNNISVDDAKLEYASQYNYQFQAIKNNKLLTKASFCRILKNNQNEYFILTCFHNIKQDAEQYQLYNNDNNIVKISLLSSETNKIKALDAAILKVDDKSIGWDDCLKNEFKPKLYHRIPASAIGYKQLNLKSPILAEGGSGGCVFDENFIKGIYLGSNMNSDINKVLSILNINKSVNTKYMLT